MRFKTCLIPCGGQNTRFGGQPKHKARVRGKSILDHIKNYWAANGVEDFVLLEEPGGLVQALNGCPHIDEPCVIHLGDCLVSGEFAFPVRMRHGFGVIEDDRSEWGRSYAVGIEDGHADELIEKPLLGMGVYFLDPGDFPLLARGKGLTEALNHLPGLQPVLFTGRYLNVTYPEDLERW